MPRKLSDWLFDIEMRMQPKRQDGTRDNSGGTDISVRLWTVETGLEIRVLALKSNMVRTVAFSPDGSTFFIGTTSGLIYHFETKRFL